MIRFLLFSTICEMIGIYYGLFRKHARILIFFSMDPTILIITGICLFLVCAFEFINGFHDTANAVAPVIYSNSLTPKKAVALAAFFNFVGVII